MSGAFNLKSNAKNCKDCGKEFAAFSCAKYCLDCRVKRIDNTGRKNNFSDIINK